ncbi:MAG: hypothetical protein MK076_03135, partial [Flavobacteriales bacterium]|nr:hypothetical protein [Flavobacteriales bacterium]
NDIIERISEEEVPYWSLDKYLMTLSGVNGITINTIHQAKGLEYQAVILDQMNLGRIPYQMWNRSTGEFMPAAPDEVEDGRNLFYVAMSRAKRYLIITHNWNPSRFINIAAPT